MPSQAELHSLIVEWVIKIAKHKRLDKNLNCYMFPLKIIGSSSMCLLEIDPAYCTIGIIIFTLIDMNSQKVQMLLALNLNVKI